MISDHSRIIGVDYGSKLAGTTCIAHLIKSKLYVTQSEVKGDADEWLKTYINDNAIKIVFLDAPLSLPAAFQGRGDDFMYRKGDREVQAMSPMFLGGLTARAMKLKHELNKSNIDVIEVYPGGFIKTSTALKDHYHKKDKTSIPKFMELLYSIFKLDITTPITNYHQVDSILALLIGLKYIDGIAASLGDEEEGLIWI